MNGRNLLFEDESFDVVFSISSIEHFGGHKEAARSVREMVRVFSPAGCW